MDEDYFVIRIPRLAGRKTLAFNLALLAFAAYSATSATLGALWAPLGLQEALGLAFVALANMGLRMATDRPVHWRERVEHGFTGYGAAREVSPSLNEWADRQIGIIRSDHDRRNEMNARNIETHLQHLRAAELPVDFDDGESDKIIDMVNREQARSHAVGNASV